jgi:hypothetical protein
MPTYKKVHAGYFYYYWNGGECGQKVRQGIEKYDLGQAV